MHNLTNLSFSGSSDVTGTGTGARVTLTPFIELELEFVETLATPVIAIDVGLQFALGPNPEGYFGPKCVSITVAPTVSASVTLEIAFFKDITANIGSYTLPELHLWDGPCISYAGTIVLHQDRASANVLGSSHGVTNVTMTFDGQTPAKFTNSAVWQPFEWSGTQVVDTAQVCGSHAQQIDSGPGAELSGDAAQAFVMPDGPVLGGRVYTDFHEAPFSSSVAGVDCAAQGFNLCCDGFGAIDVYNYDGFSTLPTLGPAGLGGEINGTGSGTTDDGETTTEVTVTYDLTPVEVTP